MTLSFPRPQSLRATTGALLTAAALASLPGVVRAQTFECTFEKVTSPGMGSAQNTRDFLGEKVIFDTSGNRVRVEWNNGKSGWFAAEEVMRNNRFMTYNIYEEVGPEGDRATIKIIFRLYNDKTRAEVRSEPQVNPGGGRVWKQNAARYACG